MKPVKTPARAASKTAKAKPRVKATRPLVASPEMCASYVFQEIVHRGRGTAKSIAARLAKRGVKYRIKDVQQALDAGLAKGTFAKSNGETYLSSHSLEILR